MTSLTDLLPDGAVLHVSCHADNKVLSLYGGTWHETSLSGPRGIARGPADGRTAVATEDGIVVFDAAGRRAVTLHADGLRPHELVYDAQDRLQVAAAAHSSVYTVSDLGRLDEHFVPAGTDSGTTDGRSWINGLALRNGQVGYATALGLSNSPAGWREQAKDSRGVLIDLATNQVVLDGLLMPHSPRVSNGQVYLLNSGHGQLLRWTPGDASASIVASFRGFARGLLILGDKAIIGISQGRFTAIPALTTDALAQPGLAVIDLVSGEQTDFVSLDITEVFDIALGSVVLGG